MTPETLSKGVYPCFPGVDPFGHYLFIYFCLPAYSEPKHNCQYGELHQTFSSIPGGGSAKFCRISWVKWPLPLTFTAICSLERKASEPSLHDLAFPPSLGMPSDFSEGLIHKRQRIISPAESVRR